MDFKTNPDECSWIVDSKQSTKNSFLEITHTNCVSAIRIKPLTPQHPPILYENTSFVSFKKGLVSGGGGGNVKINFYPLFPGE